MDAAPTQIEVATEMHDYYAGEARSAYVILGLGAASIAGGSILVTRDDDFARGYGWPLLVLGALEGVGAAFYAFQVHAEVRHYEASFAVNSAVFRADELTHLRGTTKRFIDEMNNDRAHEYLGTVERFDPHAPRGFVPAASTPWMFSYGAAF